MMRYQGLSPGNQPLSNGRRSDWRTCKEEDGLIGTRELDEDSSTTIPNFADGHKGVPRFIAPSSKPPQDNNFSTFSGDSPPENKNNHHHNEVNHNNNQVQNGDVLLKWGHRKRSRLSRSSENKAASTAGSMTTTTTTDDSSSSSSPQIQAMINVKRRSVSLPTQTVASVQETNNAANIDIMPPPVAITAVTNVVTCTSNGKGGNFKSCSKDTSSVFGNRRNSEERSAVGGSHPLRNVRVAAASATMVGGGGAAAAAASSSRSTKLGKRSPSKVVEKQHDHKRSITTTGTNTTTVDTGSTTTIPCSLRVGDDESNGFMQQTGGALGKRQQQQQHNNNKHKHNNNNNNNSIASCSLQEAAGCSSNTNVNTSTNHHGHIDNVNAKNEAVAANGEVNEWPRVYIPLTRKEKEEDFLLMKGTKLPHRPKKRPKAVDRMLQYCFPGMWLSDVAKARYEVKEKKSTTKKPKRRGLKGMESMDTDSE